MQLVSLTAAALSFGDRPLLDRIDLKIDAGERIGLIGRNGTGKSTLLRVIAGITTIDEGRRQQKNSLRIVQVDQEPVLLERPTLGASLQAQIEAFEHADERQTWRQLSRLAEFMTRFGLDTERRPATLSGGERKRAALSFAFAVEPELLMLDEPTNHLDIEGIEQLETLVCEMPALLVITHYIHTTSRLYELLLLIAAADLVFRHLLGLPKDVALYLSVLSVLVALTILVQCHWITGRTTNKPIEAQEQEDS